MPPLRLFKTFNILCLAVLHGLTVSLFGPSLLDLAEIFHSDIQHVSYLSFTQTFAALVGCTCANWIYRKFHSQNVIIFGVLLEGLSNAALPLMKSLEGGHVVSFVFGFSLGFLETGVYVWLVTLYAESRLCSAVLQTYHSMSGVGNLIGSLIIRPYIAPQSISDHKDSASKIYIAYLMVAAFAVALAFSLFVSKLIDSAPDVKVQKDGVKETNAATADHTLLALLIGLHCLIFLLIFLCFSRYFPVYIVLKGASKHDSVVNLSSFYSCFTVSRFVSIFFASKFRPKLFLVIVDVVFFASVVFFYYYGSICSMNLFTSISLLGATSGPIYAAGTAYLVSRLKKINHAQTSVLKFMSNCGGLIPPLIIGPLIESSPEVFPKVIFSSTALLVIVCGSVLLVEAKQLELDDCKAREKSTERVELLSKIM